ncbi:MAG: Tryptophan/tyrosine permease family protein [Parcubacteria group bacterium ADurb.Bin305]|nr:MAG: Tryptophan/tyrosine permease family protein [Parcubacteria group bacterium ADurb.Bin305]
MKNFVTLEAVAILVGTIIGAGVFSLPYVAVHSGLNISLRWAVVTGGLVLFIHLAFGEVVLRTNGNYRLPGYANHYLGKPAYRFLLITTFLMFSFSLLIYLLMGSQFVHTIIINIFPSAHPSEALILIILWLFFSFFLVLQEGAASKLNFYFSFILLALFLIIGILCFSKFNWQVFQGINHFADQPWYLPYGVLFYALNGLVAVPEAAALLKKHSQEKKLKKVIVLGSLIPLIIYIFFIIAVVGVNGVFTSPDAVSGLLQVLGRPIVLLGALLGFLAVATSYLMFAVYIKNSFIYDFKWSPSLSYLVVILGPLLLYLLNISELISVMSLLGGLLGGLEGLVVLFVLNKAKQKSDFIPNYQMPWNPFILTVMTIALLAGALIQLGVVL